MQHETLMCITHGKKKQKRNQRCQQSIKCHAGNSLKVNLYTVQGNLFLIRLQIFTQAFLQLFTVKLDFYSKNYANVSCLCFLMTSRSMFLQTQVMICGAKHFII